MKNNYHCNECHTISPSSTECKNKKCMILRGISQRRIINPIGVVEGVVEGVVVS
jgi:hypothetical protein